jgi:hypothetical protein
MLNVTSGGPVCGRVTELISFSKMSKLFWCAAVGSDCTPCGVMALLTVGSRYIHGHWDVLETVCGTPGM